MKSNKSREDRNEYQKLLMRRLWQSDVSSVYTLKNKITGRVYVGSTKRKPDIRFQNHKDSLYNEKSRAYNTFLKQEMRLYGIEQFDFEVVLTCSKEDQRFEEQRLIDTLRELSIDLYNERDAVSKKEMKAWYLKKTQELLSNMGLSM